MLSDIFYWLLNLSVFGTVVGLLVLILRRLEFLPRFFIYLLWSLPFLRFWLPWGIASKYSLLTWLTKYTSKTITVWQSPSGIGEITMSNITQAARSYFPIVYKTNLLQQIFTVAAVVWLGGVLILFSCSLFLYAKTKLAVKDAEHLKDNIYYSNKTSVPAIYGIWKPRIILPVEQSDDSTVLVIKHELIHIKRKDNLWRFLAIFTACLHWFNPLIWLFVKYFFIDMELACDAGVLKQLPENKKKDYAGVLLSNSYRISSFASSFGGVKTKMRIENILTYKKLTIFSSLCFVVLFITLSLTLITNAVGK